jgi:hypothetical protein
MIGFLIPESATEAVSNVSMLAQFAEPAPPSTDIIFGAELPDAVISLQAANHPRKVEPILTIRSGADGAPYA